MSNESPKNHPFSLDASVRRLSKRTLALGIGILELAALGIFRWIVPEESVWMLPTRLALQVLAGVILLFLGMALLIFRNHLRGTVKKKFGLAFDENMEVVCPVDFAPLSYLPEKGGWALRCPTCGAHYASHA